MNFIYGYKFRELNSEEILYSDVDDVNPYTRELTRFRKALVTHNGDKPASDMIKAMGGPPYCKWFSTNVDVDNIDIESIPIGLENPEWHTSEKKGQKILQLPQMQPEKLRLCCAIFNTQTHPSRVTAYNYFKDQLWCLTRNSVNGQYFNDYIITMATSKFAICPRGNGIDTHRIWEALYVGTIPIVEQCINTIELAKVLPIVVVESFTEVTLAFLQRNEYYLELFKKQPLLSEALDMNYWIERIKNAV